MFLSTISIITIIVLLVAPANATPSLNIGSSANYSLSIVLNANQSCNASPVTYNQTACGPPVPQYSVYIVDVNAGCIVTVNSTTSCFFSPTNTTVLPNYPVVWSNVGQIPHEVATCDSANSPTSQGCPVNNNFGLDSFNSSVISPGATFSHTFNALGTYFYFDPIHPWMHGTITVTVGAPPPSPIPISPQLSPLPITISGSMGWNVVGLDKSTAVLNVTYALSVTVDDIPIAPVSESGSFQQSIDLSTRVQSLGSVADMAGNLVLPLLGLALSGTTSPGISSSSALSSKMPTIYTVWWVNGPLSSGSPVQILSGYSSVQGAETVNLAAVGPRAAWVVSSNVEESLSIIAPQLGSLMNPAGPGGPLSTNDANARLALRFDYDQSSDLLLSSSGTAFMTASSTNAYPTGSTLCGTSGQCTTVSTLTTVSRVMTTSVSASLTLSGTNLNLDSRMGSSATQRGRSLTSMFQDLLSQPILFTIPALAATAIASLVVWVTKRRNLRISSVIATPQPNTPPQ
jgi:plastocyanin